MKKFISILALSLVLILPIYSQVVPVVMPTTATVSGTLTASTTLETKGTYENVSIQGVITQLTGTNTGTYGLLQTSVDGVNYINYGTDTLKATGTTTATKIWLFTNNDYEFYKVKYVGIGTQTSQVKSYLLGTPSVNGHVVVSMLSNYSKVSDTITNSGSGYVDLQLKNWYNGVTFQIVVTKISGTVGGTVTLQGSNDGINFVTVSGSYSDAQTMTALNQTTTTAMLKVTGSPYSYYRLNYVGTGTMSATLKGYVLGNKK